MFGPSLGSALTLAGFAAGPAAAQTAGVWGGTSLASRIQLYDALLVDARGDQAGAVDQYEKLSRTLSDTDPTLADALYWLGLGQWELGHVPEARRALLDGIRTGGCPMCRDLLEAIELDAASIRAIPTAIGFESGNHTVFHPWRVQQLGSIGVGVGPAGDAALEWTTLARPGDPDRLVIGLGTPTPPPTAFAFDVWSTALDAVLDVVAEDDDGRQWSLEAYVEVPRGPKTHVWVPLASLVPTDAPPDRALAPSELVSLSIVDRTALKRSGPNDLWIDDLELK